MDGLAYKDEVEIPKLSERISDLECENNHLKYKLGDRDVAFEVFARETWDKTINLIDKHINDYNESLKKYSKDEKLYDILMHKRGALKYFKECFEVMIGRKHYCTDCEHLQYDKDYEDMDCGNVYALPENGAPEIISSEVNTCPFFKQKGGADME